MVLYPKKKKPKHIKEKIEEYISKIEKKQKITSIKCDGLNDNDTIDNDTIDNDDNYNKDNNFNIDSSISDNIIDDNNHAVFNNENEHEGKH